MKQLKFLFRKKDLFALQFNNKFFRIYYQAINLDRLIFFFRYSSEKCIHATDKNFRTHGLAYVIIGTCLQAPDLRAFIVQSSQKNYKCISKYGLASQYFTNLDAAFLRHHNIQDNEIRKKNFGFFNGFVPVLRSNYLVSFIQQVVS